MEFCRNCESPISSNYCQNCGQATSTKRIDFSYLLSQTLSVFNTDKGLFYTIKRLLTKPGEAIKEYLNGKRVLYSKPFVFVFVTTQHLLNDGKFNKMRSLKLNWYIWNAMPILTYRLTINTLQFLLCERFNF